MTNDEIVQSVGERIREARGDRTLKQMAEASGKTLNTWWRYEAGHMSSIFTPNAARIADALGVKLCVFEDEEAA